MGFQCGIVGLPNVGKSTLFNALTQAGIEASNYPFCTIEPNVGIVSVPDERLYKIADLAESKNIIPTTVKFVDIAGLVAGASQGEGLGNKFLAHIRETQAIAHVVRCFEDKNVTHVSGQVDPVADIQTIETELALADLDTIERASIKIKKEAQAGLGDARQRLTCFEQIVQQLNDQHFVNWSALSDKEKEWLAPYQLLTAKPLLYVANVDEEALHNGNQHTKALEQYALERGAPWLPICANIEAEIQELSPEDRDEFLASLGLTEPGLHRLILSGYTLLQLNTYFTAGPQEARAWTYQNGMTAPQTAGIIHTDFEKGFIRAEVVSYDDFIDCQGEQKAKAAGKWRLEGKDYVVQDGDIMHFRFAT